MEKQQKEGQVKKTGKKEDKKKAPKVLLKKKKDVKKEQQTPSVEPQHSEVLEKKEKKKKKQTKTEKVSTKATTTEKQDGDEVATVAQQHHENDLILSDELIGLVLLATNHPYPILRAAQVNRRWNKLARSPVLLEQAMRRFFTDQLPKRVVDWHFLYRQACIVTVKQRYTLKKKPIKYTRLLPLSLQHTQPHITTPHNNALKSGV